MTQEHTTVYRLGGSNTGACKDNEGLSALPVATRRDAVPDPVVGLGIEGPGDTLALRLGADADGAQELS